MDRIVIWGSSRTAENFFKCYSYDGAWQDDLVKMINILTEANVPDHERWQRITEADSRARPVMSAIGPKRTSSYVAFDVAFGGKADIRIRRKNRNPPLIHINFDLV
jgi:hypothetical protein